ncbi:MULTISPECIES: hypothetical protein [unclassified Acinetobacter]|uniref:beta-sandwich lipoprotein n=1 Tax=unclassified Acinetobacter TaxID=196816 RepID=UPI0029347D1F|nr:MULTISPECIES: hypothetical protein [unclassified Acinetobacter]
MKKCLLAAGLMCVVAMVGCARDAQVASKNLSYAADNFELDRRVVFYNGITGDYILTIEGKCSFEPVGERKVDVTCKTGPSEFKKHSLGISDNVTYFSEQLSAKGVSTYHYKVAFKPQAIIPDVDLKIN